MLTLLIVKDTTIVKEMPNARQHHQCNMIMVRALVSTVKL